MERQLALMGMFFCEENKSTAIRKSIYTDTYYHLCAVSLRERNYLKDEEIVFVHTLASRLKYVR